MTTPRIPALAAKLFLGLTLPAATFACQASNVNSSLAGSKHIDRPIEETPSLSVPMSAAQLPGGREVVVYYVNETDLDTATKARRDVIIRDLETVAARPEVPAAEQHTLKVQAQALRDDEALFKAAAQQDIEQLRKVLCGKTTSELFVFTNQLLKQGQYQRCGTGQALTSVAYNGLSEVTAAINHEPAETQDAYRSSPQAHRTAFQAALKEVQTRLAASSYVTTVDLITKSHGNADNAMVPPLQKVMSKEVFQKYLALLGAAQAASTVTGSSSLGTEGSSLGTEGSSLGTEGSSLGTEGSSLGAEGSSLGDVGSSLGGIGIGITKLAYAQVINGASLPYSLIFLEACNAQLPLEARTALVSKQPKTKIWTSDKKGLIYRTISDYGSLNISGKGGFAQALDSALKAANAQRIEPNDM